MSLCRGGHCPPAGAHCAPLQSVPIHVIALKYAVGHSPEFPVALLNYDTITRPEYARDTEKIPPSVFLPLIGLRLVGEAQQVVGGDIVVFTQRGKPFNGSTSGAAFNFTDVALSCSDNQAEISLIYVGL